MGSCSRSNDELRPGNADGFTVHIDAKTFPPAGDAPAVTVLENLHFTITPGELLAIIGPSGCGKTTLLNIIAGLDTDFAGNVSGPIMAGFVFQSPRLLPWMTVAGNLRLVLDADEAQDDRITAMLQSVGLQGQENVYANRLSMGMARRVALARALLVEPDIMLLDEPFVSLDEGTAEKLLILLAELLDEKPRTALFVTHDLSEAVRLADRVLLMGGQPTTIISDVPLKVLYRDRDALWLAEAEADLRSRL